MWLGDLLKNDKIMVVFKGPDEKPRNTRSLQGGPWSGAHCVCAVELVVLVACVLIRVCVI